jgi:phage gp36-like protein
MTNILENHMNEVKKADCISMEKAQEALKVARGTLSSYMAVLHIPRYKFPLDRRAYITLTDFELVKQAIEENR